MLRREQCVALAARKYNEVAGKMLGIMFDLACSSGSWQGAPESRMIGLSEIQMAWALATTAGGGASGSDLAQLSDYLSVIVKDPAKLVRPGTTGSGESGYSLRFEVVFELVQQTEVEGVIAQRYDPLALRLFRFINIHRYAEETQIADECVAPPNDAKKLLMQMYKENVLNVVTVPKTIDRHPLRCIFLYQADYQHCARLFSLHTAQVIKNLMLRFQHLEKANAALLVKLDGAEGTTTLSASEAKKLSHYRRVSAQLQSTICHLDNSMMLLNRFDTAWQAIPKSI